MIFYEGHKVYMNGEIPKNCIIHHKDHNKLNWDIDNLELLDRSQHIHEHRAIVHRKGVKVIAIKGNQRLEFDSIEDASEYCGTYTSNIQRIFKGKQKTAKGWTFIRGD